MDYFWRSVYDADNCHHPIHKECLALARAALLLCSCSGRLAFCGHVGPSGVKKSPWFENVCSATSLPEALIFETQLQSRSSTGQDSRIVKKFVFLATKTVGPRKYRAKQRWGFTNVLYYPTRKQNCRGSQLWIRTWMFLTYNIGVGESTCCIWGVPKLQGGA